MQLPLDHYFSSIIQQFLQLKINRKLQCKNLEIISLFV